MFRIYFVMLTIVVIPISGCGTYTPDKRVYESDLPSLDSRDSPEGKYETAVLTHISCEIAEGLWETRDYKLKVPWLEKWGTAVTLTITAQEQGGLNPGVAFLTPLRNIVKSFSIGGNVTSMQSFSLGLGASASANATRTETIQITYQNEDLLRATEKIRPTCQKNGLMIDGDLKLRQFFFDKAVFADTGNGNPNADRGWPIYNTLTDEVSFVASYGGSFNPSWKLADISANTASNLASAQRTYTNDLIITVGPIDHGPRSNEPTALKAAAQAQHNTKVQAQANATSISGQSHQ